MSNGIYIFSVDNSLESVLISVLNGGSSDNSVQSDVKIEFSKIYFSKTLNNLEKYFYGVRNDIKMRFDVFHITKISSPKIELSVCHLVCGWTHSHIIIADMPVRLLGMVNVNKQHKNNIKDEKYPKISSSIDCYSLVKMWYHFRDKVFFFFVFPRSCV